MNIVDFISTEKNLLYKNLKNGCAWLRKYTAEYRKKMLYKNRKDVLFKADNLYSCKRTDK